MSPKTHSSSLTQSQGNPLSLLIAVLYWAVPAHSKSKLQFIYTDAHVPFSNDLQGFWARKHEV